MPPPPLWPPPSASLACPLPLLVRLLPAPHGRSASWRGVHNRPESAADRRHAAWPGPPRRVRELAFAPPLLPTAARGYLRPAAVALAVIPPPWLFSSPGGGREDASRTSPSSAGPGRPNSKAAVTDRYPGLRDRPPTLRRNHACLDRTRLVLEPGEPLAPAMAARTSRFEFVASLPNNRSDLIGFRRVSLFGSSSSGPMAVNLI